MDAKDVRIFCEIAFKDLSYRADTQRHVSPTEIGRKLSLDERTVRTRITKMEEDGFIRKFGCHSVLVSEFARVWLFLIGVLASCDSRQSRISARATV